MNQPPDRLPPNDPAAETCLLACVMLSPAEVLDLIRAKTGGRVDLFFDLRHRTLYGCLEAMQHAGEHIDVITVATKLHAQGRLDQVGGLDFLSPLPDRVPSAAGAPGYLGPLVDLWQRRQIIELARRAEAAAFSGEPGGVEALHAEASRLRDGVAREAVSAYRFDQLCDYDTQHDPNCVLGIRADGSTSRWLCRGAGAWLNGQTGLGKSSLGMQMVTRWAIGAHAFGVFPARPLRVLAMQAENDTGDCAEQAQGIRDGLGLDEFSPDWPVVLQNLKVIREQRRTGREWAEFLRREIVAHRADLVLVDPFLSFAGINVSDQEQVSILLRNWINPILEETGAVLLCVHHVPKPSRDKSRGQAPQNNHDKAYAGAGASELANWARESMVLEAAGDGFYRLTMTKRGRRSGATHPSGEPTSVIWLRHAQGRICWEQVDPPEESEERGERKGGRTNEVERLLALPVGEFLDRIPPDGEGLREMGRRLEEWARSKGFRTAQGEVAGETLCVRVVKHWRDVSERVVKKAGRLVKCDAKTIPESTL